MKERIKPINRYAIFNIFLIFVVYLLIGLISKFNYFNDINHKLIMISCITNICFIWCVYSIYKIKKNIFDFNIIFLTFLFLFCNGQLFLYSLGVRPDKMSVFILSSRESIYNAGIYFCYSLLFFQLGTLLSIKKINNNNLSEAKTSEQFLQATRIVALLLTIFTSIFFFINIVPKLSSSIKYGYEFLYESSQVQDGILIYFSKMFVPSLLLLLYSFKDKNIARKLIMFFLALIVIMHLIIGSRGSAISIVVVLIVFYHTFIKKIKGIRFVGFTILLLLIMITIPTIYEFRSQENKNILSFIDTIHEVTEDSESNVMTKTISELGYTMHSFILTYNVVPSRQNYKFGESYISSILMLIPSKLLGGYSFAEKAALDNWLQDIYRMSYGPGFSIVAETYYNFGWYFGILFSFILGILYTKMFNFRNSNNDKNNLLKMLSLIFLYNSLLSARYPFHSTTRNIVYMYFLIYALILITYGNIKRRSNDIK